MNLSVVEFYVRGNKQCISIYLISFWNIRKRTGWSSSDFISKTYLHTAGGSFVLWYIACFLTGRGFILNNDAIWYYDLSTLKKSWWWGTKRIRLAKCPYLLENCQLNANKNTYGCSQMCNENNSFSMTINHLKSQ